MKFQTFKLDLEKTEEPKIKLPQFTGSSKKQQSPRKTSTSALLTILKTLTVWITINCGKYFKRWKHQTIPDHLTCLLRNLYADQEATVRTEHRSADWFQIGKVNAKAVYFTYMQSISCEMPGWMKHKLESRLPPEISTPQICRWQHFYGRKWRATKEPLY